MLIGLDRGPLRRLVAVCFQGGVKCGEGGEGGVFRLLRVNISFFFAAWMTLLGDVRTGRT